MGGLQEWVLFGMEGSAEAFSALPMFWVVSLREHDLAFFFLRALPVVPCWNLEVVLFFVPLEVQPQ